MKILIIILPLIFSGCISYETQANKNHRRFQQNIETSFNNYSLCMDQFSVSDEAVRLEVKYIINLKNDRNLAAKMSITEFASKNDVNDFVKYQEKIKYCQEQIVKEHNWIDRIDKKFSIVSSEHFMITGKNIENVISGKYSIGDYNKKYIYENSVYFKALKEEIERLNNLFR